MMESMIGFSIPMTSYPWFPHVETDLKSIFEAVYMPGQNTALKYVACIYATFKFY
jgi:hypothetical protein